MDDPTQHTTSHVHSALVVSHRNLLDLGIDVFAESCQSEDELQTMMRTPHTDCFPTPATFTWQGAGEGMFM